MKTVSVIVPIYKVELYLNKCIDSILNQTYKNLEVILIDDGSPDNCPLICDEYAKRDSRIRVIHKKNGGLSDARNVGIEIMQGEYVTFVDSDDFLEAHCIERLVYCMEDTDSDISICDYYSFIENSFINRIAIENGSIELFDSENALKSALVGNPFALSAWGKLYKSNLFVSIRYPKGKIYEDLGTTYKILDLANKICYVPEKMYYYLIRKSSISYDRFSKNKMDMLYYSEEMMRFIEKNYTQDIDEAKIRVATSAVDLLRDMGLNKGNDVCLYRNKCYHLLKQYRRILLKNSKINVKYKIFSIISFLGKYAVGFVEIMNRKIK